MSIRRLSRCLSALTVATLLTLGPGLSSSLAGDVGSVPPNPASPDWAAEIGTGLYALTLIY